MTVWIVRHNVHFEGSSIEAVYSDKGRAEALADEMSAQLTAYDSEDYSIEEWVVR